MTSEKNKDLGSEDGRDITDIHQSTAPKLSCNNPIQTFSSKTQDLEKMTQKNYTGICWSIRNYLMNLNKKKLVYCDTSKTKAGDISSPDRDKVSVNETKPEVREYKLIHEEVEDFLQNETPMERLQRSFTKDEISKTYIPDIEIYRNGLKYSVTVVSCYGFITGCQAGKDGFIRRNRFTLYSYPKAMYNRLMNAMIQVGLKYVIKANLKFLRYIVPAMAFEKCLTIYRNKSSPLHFATAFGLSGSINTFMLGPKGMISGGLISGTFGLVMGSCYYLISSSFGFDQESLNRKAVYNLIEQKRSYRKPEPVINVSKSSVLNISANAQDQSSEEEEALD